MMATVASASRPADPTAQGTLLKWFTTASSTPLCNALHNGVLDAVVNHFNKVPCAVGSAVRDALATAAIICRHFCEERFDDAVPFFGSTRHHAGTVQGSGFAARDAHADEVDTLFL